MKTIDIVRRENARMLAEKVGGNSVFSEKIDRETTQISRFLGRNFTKNIGDIMARHIEERFSLPRGWLDQDWSKGSGSDTDTNAHVVISLGLCPLISKVQAGAWTEAVDVHEEGYAEDWMPCPVKHGKHTYILQVEGESMFDPRGPKSFRNGDYIFVDPERQPESGSLVIAKKDDEQAATFKQLIIEGDKKYLKALNRDWPERILEIDDSTRICGVVICRLEQF